MSISEESAVLEGQTSIEDLLAEPLLNGRDDALLQGCLPGMEDMA